MKKEQKTKIKIIIIASIIIILGVELLREQIGNIFATDIKPKPLQILLEFTIPLFLCVIGVSFAFLKKWAISLVRTTLLFLILFGFLMTIFAIYIGFIGMPPLLLYLMMLAAGISLGLIEQTDIKEKFEEKRDVL